MLTGSLALTLLLFHGQATLQPQPREVRRIDWQLLQTTEVLLRLEPVGPDGEPVRVSLVFHAFFPGRAERDPYSGQPRWPKGPPARLTVTAQAFPLTFVIPKLALQFIVDAATVDLTGSDRNYRNIPCLIAGDDCVPDGVEADLDAAVLRSLIGGRVVRGVALGFPFVLAHADQEALAAFATRIGLSETPGAPGDPVTPR